MDGSMRIEQAFTLACERYAELGVDPTHALKILRTISVSLHCWQGDDVGGFEGRGGEIGGGLAVTGSYPGKARTPDELRADLDQALKLIPGTHRLNLHASYAELGGKPVDRDCLEPRHFQNWIDWAKARHIGLDFNPTFFAHPMADDGFTLAHRDEAVRAFWVRHGIACRDIGAAMGKALGHALRDECLDSRRLQGHAGRPARAARAARPLARRDLPNARSTRPTTSTRSSPSCSASAPKATSSGRTSSTSATPSETESSSASTPATITRPKGIADKLSAVLHVARPHPAARQPRRALGQRPCRHADRRPAGDRAGTGPRRLPRPRPTSASTTSTPASTAWPRG